MWELGENIFLSFYNYTPSLQKLNRDMEDIKNSYWTYWEWTNYIWNEEYTGWHEW